VTGTATDRVTTPANVTAKMAAPGAIGGTTPGSGAFSTLSATGIITATGGQIGFPATAVPSADANTLDDYEEGTYTLTIVGSTSGNYNLNGSRETLQYRKIGNMCFVGGEVAIANADGTPVGDLRFSLPFTASALTEFSEFTLGSALIWGHGGSLPNAQYSRPGTGVAYFNVVHVTDGGTFDLIEVADVDTLWDFAVSLWYVCE